MTTLDQLKLAVNHLEHIDRLLSEMILMVPKTLRPIITMIQVMVIGVIPFLEVEITEFPEDEE